MKNTILIAVIILLLTSCTKEYEERKITYLITGLGTEYKLSYLNEEGETINEKISPSGTTDVWKYNFTARQGDLVYLFTEFYEKIDHKTFQFRILVDGKVYKDSYGYDHNQADTLFRVLRSGVIPY